MEIILKPIVTEKMTQMGDKLGKYGFIVSRSANKVQIKKAVESMYDVTVESVNTIRTAGKSKMRYTKAGILRGKTASYKKAIITLAKGQTIDFYSNI